MQVRFYFSSINIWQHSARQLLKQCGKLNEAKLFCYRYFSSAFRQPQPKARHEIVPSPAKILFENGDRRCPSRTLLRAQPVPTASRGLCLGQKGHIGTEERILFCIYRLWQTIRSKTRTQQELSKCLRN